MTACTCPVWESADDFDGPEDHAEACTSCLVHGDGTLQLTLNP